MVVKNASDYMNDTLVDRIKTLQDALNQAELIIHKIEQENHNLKMVLSAYKQDELMLA